MSTTRQTCEPPRHFKQRSGASDSSASAPSRARSLKVFVMDLGGYIPYYNACLCKSLREEGVSVALGSISYHRDVGCFSRHHLRPEPGLLDVVGRLGIRTPGLRRALKFLEFCLNMTALTIRFVISKPDIIHVQYLALLERGLPFELWFLRLARKMGIQLVYTVHNVLPHDMGGRHRENYKLVYGLVDLLITHTRDAKQRLVQEFLVNPRRIWVVPHGPLFHDTPRPTLAQARERIGLPKDSCVVLWQGNVKPYKGLDFLLEAWQRVHTSGLRAWLIIAGSGEGHLMQAVKDKVLSLGVRKSVKLELRFIPSDELPFFYQAADILVYPYKEITQSGALLTGLSFGKATIATPLPAFQELLTNGENALLVRYGDTEGLAAALMKLIQDPRERRRLSVSAATLEQASWTGIAQRTRECYEAVLQQGRGH